MAGMDARAYVFGRVDSREELALARAGVVALEEVGRAEEKGCDPAKAVRMPRGFEVHDSLRQWASWAPPPIVIQAV